MRRRSWSIQVRPRRASATERALRGGAVRRPCNCIDRLPSCSTMPRTQTERLERKTMHVGNVEITKPELAPIRSAALVVGVALFVALMVGCARRRRRHTSGGGAARRGRAAGPRRARQGPAAAGAAGAGADARGPGAPAARVYGGAELRRHHAPGPPGGPARGVGQDAGRHQQNRPCGRHHLQHGQSGEELPRRRLPRLPRRRRELGAQQRLYRVDVQDPGQHAVA